MFVRPATPTTWHVHPPAHGEEVATTAVVQVLFLVEGTSWGKQAGGRQVGVAVKIADRARHAKLSQSPSGAHSLACRLACCLFNKGSPAGLLAGKALRVVNDKLASPPGEVALHFGQACWPILGRHLKSDA